MEIPWPKWMEYVVLGLSIGFGTIAYIVIDRFQKRRDEQTVQESS